MFAGRKASEIVDDDGGLRIKYESDQSYSSIHPSMSFVSWGSLPAAVRDLKTALPDSFKPKPPSRDSFRDEEEDDAKPSKDKKRKGTLRTTSGNAADPVVQKKKTKLPTTLPHHLHLLSPEVFRQAAAAAAAAVGVNEKK